jgi:hypothetical protein
MPKNRRQQNKERRFNLMDEGSGGLISASDNIMNERRVRTNLTARMIRTVKPFLGSLTRVSDDLAIANILADLRHYCECKRLAFAKLQKAAYALYLEEKAYESTWLAPSVHLGEVRYGLHTQEGVTSINITKNRGRRN